VTRWPLELRAATASDYQSILGLVDGATRWLSSKGIDQWAKPWPDEQGRNARVLDDLLNGKTWLATDGAKVAATITIDPVDNGVWPPDKRKEPALYLRRAIVDRDYGGREVGACLFDWASDIATDAYRAKWIRIDVWTTNFLLHDYYRAQDFEYVGLRDVVYGPDYPSRALFQRSTAQRRPGYEKVLRLEQPPEWW
jgi:hypothetical protein